MLCNAEGPHYHNNNSLNKFNVGPLRPISSNVNNRRNNSRRNNKTRKAILNAYVGINEERAKKLNMKNTIRAWRMRNKKLAKQSLKNDRKAAK